MGKKTTKAVIGLVCLTVAGVAVASANVYEAPISWQASPGYAYTATTPYYPSDAYLNGITINNQSNNSVSVKINSQLAAGCHGGELAAFQSCTDQQDVQGKTTVDVEISDNQSVAPNNKAEGNYILEVLYPSQS